MNKPIRLLIITSALALAALQAFGQSNTPPAAPPLPAPLDQATNVANAPQLFSLALNLLPAWDPTATNTFGPNEFTIESAPLWKTMTASGTTPYNSTEGDYFFNQNFAAGAELISLGNGTGNNAIDSTFINVTARKDVGNIAGYLLAGAGYDFNRHSLAGAVGPGIIYGYRTHLRLFLDTRFELEGKSSGNNGFLTRVGLQIPF